MKGESQSRLNGGDGKGPGEDGDRRNSMIYIHADICPPPPPSPSLPSLPPSSSPSTKACQAGRGELDAVRDKEGNTCLHAAAAAGSYEACRYLLQVILTPKPEARRRSRNTALPLSGQDQSTQ
jgi:hypothetical protein